MFSFALCSIGFWVNKQSVLHVQRNYTAGACIHRRGKLIEVCVYLAPDLAQISGSSAISKQNLLI